MMNKLEGYTIIELVLFIMITSILASTILLGLSEGTRKFPSVHQEIIATQIAQSCMEWFIGQRQINGYASLPCPNTTVPSFCTAPSGYSITTNLACTTIGSDTDFKTITVSVSGLANIVLTTLISKY